MKDKTLLGHGLAIFTVFMWGGTFISTKLLLEICNPIEILIYRFIMAYIALVCISRKHVPYEGFKREGMYALAGFSGIFLYYLFENMALDYTFASNVGIIASSVAPFATVLFAHFCLGQSERMKIQFFIGFGFSLVGISLISLNGVELQLNPLGDFLAVLSATFWAVYSVVLKKINDFGHPVLQTTRRIFFYGLLCMLPLNLCFTPRADYSHIFEATYLLNLLFLGLGASALCFITWNTAVSYIGAVKTGFYIYIMPVLTVGISVAVLHEPITAMSAAGMVFAILGLIISEYKS